MKHRGERAGLGEGILVAAALVFALLLCLLVWRSRLPQAIAVEPVSHISAETLAAPEPEKLDINSASAGELADLPGIGEELAGRIVAWRVENGAFGCVDDLDDVPGIGPGKIAGLRELVICGEMV